MIALLRQPLLHFLFLGGLVFAAYDLLVAPVDGGLDEASEIHVDSERLLVFMQQRAKAFDRQGVERQLQRMPHDERQRLIDDLVREEALYREAKALGLASDDYVIKRRLVQKLEFITQGLIDDSTELSQVDLEDYFATYRQDYFIEPHATFTHVFFDRERHGEEQSRTLAVEALKRLNQAKISFTDGIHYGDRFLYHTNYVERVPEYVASHLGEPIAEAVFSLTPDKRRWYGPYQSPYGYHLLMLASRQQGRLPGLDEVYARVRSDAEQLSRRQQMDAAIKRIIEGYQVTVMLPSVAGKPDRAAIISHSTLQNLDQDDLPEPAEEGNSESS